MNQKNISKLLKEINELKEENKKLKSKKKYGLVWEEEKEPEKVVLDCQKKLPIIKDVKIKEILIDKEKPTNILIEGDNYHALQVLNYTHKGKIDAIYIDPPYNTGAKDWKYNNKFVCEDDAYRHSKWLNLMNKRLLLAKNLLKDDGIICITIDDYEMPRLWLLLEEIFGSHNYLGTVIIRNNPSGRKTKRKVAQIHEFALFFGKSKLSHIKKLFVDMNKKTHKYIKDKNGIFYSPTNLRKQGVDSNAIKKDGSIKDRYYPIYFDPNTGKISVTEKLIESIYPIDPKGVKRIWRRGKEVINEMFKNKELWCKKTNYGYQIYYKFKGGISGEPPKSIWSESKYSASEHGTKILYDILKERESFPYPKSIFSVIECLKIMTNNKNSLFLDFFAGSGTTGQAVLELNKIDKGNRKFILCTNDENNICSDICYPRIEKVIKGYKNTKNEKIDGLSGNLKYYKTDFIDVNHITNVSDDKKLKLTYQTGELISIKEDVFEELEKNEYYQIFKSDKKIVGIYFVEDYKKIDELLEKINSYNQKKIVYLFSWGKTEYSGIDLGYSNIKIKDIPQPIIDVYKEINKL